MAILVELLLFVCNVCKPAFFAWERMFLQILYSMQSYWLLLTRSAKRVQLRKYHVLLYEQGCGRLLAGSRSLPNGVFQESDPAREAPAPH